MRVVICSRYLETQEEGKLRDAAALTRQRGVRPAGFWRRLLWLLSGSARRDRARRVARARELEVDASRYAQGRHGEELLQAVLARQLDDRYLLLRNYTPPPPDQRGGDIDAVLIGPHGINVIEVKAWNGYYQYAGEAWLYRAHPNHAWRPANKNPTLQALDNAARIRRLLERAGHGQVPVEPVIAVASRKMFVDVERPIAVPIFFAAARSPRFLAAQGESLSKDQRHAIERALLPARPAARRFTRPGA